METKAPRTDAQTNCDTEYERKNHTKARFDNKTWTKRPNGVVSKLRTVSGKACATLNWAIMLTCFW